MNKLLQTERFSSIGTPHLGASEKEQPLIALFRTLWRRKGFIIGVTLLLTGMAAVVLFRMTPLYTAETMMMLEPERKGAVVDVGAVIAGLPSDVSTIETEVEVLRSRGLAAKVAEQLGLAQHPEFNSILQPPTFWDQAKDSVVTTVTDAITVVTDAESSIIPLPSSARETVDGFPDSDVVDAFRERREVSSLGRSRMIRVAVTSENPELAARASDAIAEQYIVERLEGGLEASKTINEWLHTRVADLRADVETKESAVANFREQHDILKGTDGEDLLTQEISDINQQLTAASANRAEAEARLAEIQSLMAGGQVESAEAVLNSRLIQELRREEALLESEVSDYATRFGPQHPSMRTATAKLAEIRQSIDREVRKIARGLENTLSIARSRESRLRSQLTNAKSRVVTSNSTEVQLRSLEQEANSARTLLDSFLQRFNASNAQDQFLNQQADARIVSHADVPTNPSFPKKGSILALAMVSALLASIGLVFVRELMDDSFRASEDIERDTGARVLGHIPLIKGWRARRAGLAHHIARAPRSFEAEAVRRLCTGIQLSLRDGASNRLLFTSAQPGEGKTSLCTAVARTLAMAGKNVLLIDADIRRSKIHKALGLWQGPGLVDLMHDKCTLDDAVQYDVVSGANVIVAGFHRVDRPQDLLATEAMKELLRQSSQRYDFVILDSPPVSAVSDALLLSDLASILFVIRWGGASRKIVTHALREVLEAGGTFLGVILSQVNAREHVKYGFSDAGFYSRKSRKYYTSANDART